MTPKAICPKGYGKDQDQGSAPDPERNALLEKSKHDHPEQQPGHQQQVVAGISFRQQKERTLWKLLPGQS